jgi:hypothetical protein
MKHEFILADVNIPRPNLANLNMELRIWDSTAADATLSSADDSHSFSYITKTHVEGMTAQQLIDRERPKIIPGVQSYINTYKKAKQIESLSVITSLITDIDGTLSS